MQKKMWSVTKKILRNDIHWPLYTIFRHKTIKLPEVSQSLEERLSEINAVDPTLHFKVDIGLPPRPGVMPKELIERKKYLHKRRNDPELEKKSRLLLLNPELDDIKEEWLKNNAPAQIKMVADHYNIYQDLFGDAYFMPYISMNINYLQANKNLVASVYRGNFIKPAEAFTQPEVKFQSNPEDLWTLTMVSPDGHLTEENMEYIHWFVGNIPGGEINKGEIIWDYLPPFPARGIGYQRFIFILYKQESKIDYSKLKKQIPCLELKDRNFKTLEFYRERQEILTPGGLAFFQSDWDPTSRKVFHEILNMEEPVFEYDHLPKVLAKERWFPKKKPFNLYMDRYRDPKDISKEYLLKKLKEINPLEPPKEAFQYPKALKLRYRNMPSWLKTKELRYQTGLGRVQDEQWDEYK